MRGMQCPKNLYLNVHHPELEPAVSADKQAVFDQGHLVGSKAQELFPGGILIDVPFRELDRASQETQDAIASGVNTLYEATFNFDGIWARVDILHRPTSTAPWGVYEVKSGTSVKQEYLEDVAAQVFVLQGAGVPVGDAFVIHINSSAVAPHLENVFTVAKVTPQIREKIKAWPDRIAQWRVMLAQPEEPKIDIGEHCAIPYDCPFQDHCWKHLPEKNIFDLPSLKAWEFYRSGIVSLDDPRLLLDGIHARRLEAVRSNSRWVDARKIEKGLADWRWPLLYLDFETIGFALPRYDGSHPYQPIPFQFSALVQQTRGAELTHFEYLHQGEDDPRPAFLAALIPLLKSEGSIVAYNKAFEASRMKELALSFPVAEQTLLDACDRLVDPLPLFRAAVYDPKFAGRFSIKKVAPAILGQDSSYENMLVADGIGAQRAFEELINPLTAAERKETLRVAMLEYCKKDTQVMVGLVEWMLSVIGLAPVR